MRYKHLELTSAVINAFYDVYNRLGYGFLEKLYENALAYELQKRGHHVVQQAPIEVLYDGIVVGSYFADLLIDDAVIAELKAAETINQQHEAQLLNYLKGGRIDVGLLLNFGPKPQIKRKVFETARKQ